MRTRRSAAVQSPQSPATPSQPRVVNQGASVDPNYIELAYQHYRIRWSHTHWSLYHVTGGRWIRLDAQRLDTHPVTMRQLVTMCDLHASGHDPATVYDTVKLAAKPVNLRDGKVGGNAVVQLPERLPTRAERRTLEARAQIEAAQPQAVAQPKPSKPGKPKLAAVPSEPEADSDDHPIHTANGEYYKNADAYEAAIQAEMARQDAIEGTTPRRRTRRTAAATQLQAAAVAQPQAQALDSAAVTLRALDLAIAALNTAHALVTAKR